MSASAKPDVAEEPAPTLAALARLALTLHGNDTEKAVAVLTQNLLGDRALLRAVIEGAIADAVSYRVEAAMRSRRAYLVAVASGPGRDGVKALANGIAASMLDMSLANGVALRNATREQVVEQATRYEAFSRDTGRKARFLSLIAQSVQPHQTVGQVITDHRAFELWNEVA